MLSGFTREEQIQFYGCIGGTPHYLDQVDPDETFAETIQRLYFDISGYLYNEPMMLLQQELREPAMYNSIVAAIAAGATRLSDIANRTGEESNKVNKYLRTLVDLHIAAKQYPFGEDPASSRKAVYGLADNCYLFWYRFVFPAQPEIESGSGDIIARRILEGDLFPAFFGKPAFEMICLQFLRRMSRAGRLSFMGTSFGNWWGNDPRERRQNDIDVIMADRAAKQILLGECKWRNESPAPAAIEQLLDKDCLMPQYNEYYHCFFSKVPVGSAALQLGKERKVLLFDLEDLFTEGI